MAADALIAASYLAIPAILYYFVKRRRHEIPYWWMPALFGAFILLCGATHALGIWTIWNPDYRLDGAVKLAVMRAVDLAAVRVVVGGRRGQADPADR